MKEFLEKLAVDIPGDMMFTSDHAAYRNFPWKGEPAHEKFEPDFLVCAMTGTSAALLGGLAEAMDERGVAHIVLDTEKLPGIHLFGIYTWSPTALVPAAQRYVPGKRVQEKMRQQKCLVTQEEFAEIFRYLSCLPGNVTRAKPRIEIMGGGHAAFIIRDFHGREYGKKIPIREMMDIFSIPIPA